MRIELSGNPLGQRIDFRPVSLTHHRPVGHADTTPLIKWDKCASKILKVDLKVSDLGLSKFCSRFRRMLKSHQPDMTNAFAAIYNRFKTKISRLSTPVRFAIVATVIIGLGMGILGVWVSSRIEAGVVQHSAGTLALYLETFIEPHKAEITQTGQLSPAAIESLNASLREQGARKRIIGAKIWQTDGQIIYSSWEGQVGRKFPIGDGLAAALRGELVAELNSLDDEENEIERALGSWMLEVYVPVRQAGSDKVLAVAEVYELADGLRSNIAAARIQAGLMFGLLGLLMVASLFSFVSKASQTIAMQQAALTQRVSQLSEILVRNEDLKSRIVEANKRSAEVHEQLLNRVGSELHDGPSQLIGLGLLRLDDVLTCPTCASAKAPERAQPVRTALEEALKEIRAISSGLSLPELRGLNIVEVLDLAVANHERRTQTDVTVDFANCPPMHLSADLTNCLFRFVQEGLTNAYRHAGARGQHVSATAAAGRLTVSVKDEGPGIESGGPSSPRNTSNLGLRGMRNRIESLGGELAVVSTPGQGTELKVVFSVGEGEGHG